MARCLFIVEDTFLIRGRGLVLAPGIFPEGEERFRIGDMIRLVRPDGSSIDEKILGIDIFHPNPRGLMVILLKELTKEDAPVGTEVWSIDP